jgi:hypothetical protein
MRRIRSPLPSSFNLNNVWVVRPRIKSTVSGHEYKEARDYLAFWKAVDDVVRIVKNVSMREWPNVPPIWQSIISGIGL